MNGFKQRKRLADEILQGRRIGGTGYWLEVCFECGGVGSQHDLSGDDERACCACQGSGLIETRIEITETRRPYRPAAGR